MRVWRALVVGSLIGPCLPAPSAAQMPPSRVVFAEAREHSVVKQPPEVLTMLGFIILVGTVVNNAILVVHQSLNHMRVDGMEPREAIRTAVGNRVRPIFMSVSTSVCGMLPLVLFSGAGSELYRGLGSVVVGGLIVSTVFTLLLVPALFSLVLDARQALGRRASVALGNGRVG